MDPVISGGTSPTSYVLAKTDFTTEVENAAPNALSLNKLKHAHTEGQFNKMAARQASGTSADQRGTVENDGQDLDGDRRFDSHNMLRSNEAPDLLDLPEENAEQIWLKRSGMQRDDSVVPIMGLENDQNVPVESSGNLELTEVPQDVLEGSQEGKTRNEPSRHAAGDSGMTLSTASITATILKDDDSKAKSQSRTSVKLRRTSSTEDGRDRRQRQSLYSEGDGGLSLAGTALTGDDSSYGQGDSASGKKKKTLTRRLSSFFSRSFRRKSGQSTKRVSYSGSGLTTAEESASSSRPASSFSPTQAEFSQEEIQQYRRQQLLDFGFTLSLDELLLHEPDSFIFVPLSDSGYFSTDLSQVEKLSLTASSSHAGFEANPLATTSTSSPRAPRLRSRNETVTEQHPPEDIHRKTVEEKETPKKPRRLSFVEGTSIIENINHMVYAPASENNGLQSPHSADSSPAYGYEEDDGDGAPYGERRVPTTSQSYDQLSNTFAPHSQARRAKKLKFKNHPWRWIKSKF